MRFLGFDLSIRLIHEGKSGATYAIDHYVSFIALLKRGLAVMIERNENGETVANGVYFYSVKAGRHVSEARKMALDK